MMHLREMAAREVDAMGAEADREVKRANTSRVLKAAGSRPTAVRLTADKLAADSLAAPCLKTDKLITEDYP
jgi:hypothetical protein